MAEPLLRLEGFTELLIKMRALPAAEQRALRAAYRQAGNRILQDWANRIQNLNPAGSERTVAGYRTYVRLRGIEVEQTTPKTTGNRPDWGGTQMVYGGLPALADNETEFTADIDAAMKAALAAVSLL